MSFLIRNLYVRGEVSSSVIKTAKNGLLCFRWFMSNIAFAPERPSLNEPCFEGIYGKDSYIIYNIGENNVSGMQKITL